jgi:hypothetical protein
MRMRARSERLDVLFVTNGGGDPTGDGEPSLGRDA